MDGSAVLSGEILRAGLSDGNQLHDLRDVALAAGQCDIF
jgi:hypothetical protein